MARKFPWTTLPDEKLLQLRLKDLKVTIDGTWLEGCLADLYDELAQRDIRVRPHAWISDEWFSPNNTPGIAIPFYLTHPRLMRLERKKILDVEGGTVPECMRILRHEAGHVVQFAFELQRRRRWQQLFGRSSKRYPSYYRPNPASKNFVEHLPLWYAQSHPDEDFAETFAVWLRPRSNWRKRYADWPALEKLEYVDEVMGEIAGQKPLMAARRMHVDPLRHLDRTLAEYYKKKFARYVVDTPRTYDRALTRIFTPDTGRHPGVAASAFVRENRAEIRELVAKWTGERKLTLDTVLDGMIRRARELDLRAVGPLGKLRLDFALLVTAETVHSLYSPSRRQWFAL
ncbi:putative zinc-binding metallopeptidase [Xanthobacteraceae bacterium Astr-EGSB]|uniref:putative zinc-binding metallopeptidase n=1 Tax=Astrobacterium formosum TaxID=3069710 RepID=UPI0027B629A0|nr:putative zinc-binding metallopeptidase [Xanthobacteraceae bacterium Astr-EGSB]